MSRIAYPNEVGIRDQDIIEVRISTKKKRGKSTRKDPTDHILKVRHRIFGWLSPWEWGILAKLEKAIDKGFELINSFLRTEVGVIVFVLGGSLTLLYLFFGEKLTSFIISLVYRGTDLAQSALKQIKDFLFTLATSIPGFPDIPPIELPDVPFQDPMSAERGRNVQPGFEEESVSSNFVDAVWSLINRIIMDPLFGIGGKPPIRVNP